MRQHCWLNGENVVPVAIKRLAVILAGLALFITCQNNLSSRLNDSLKERILRDSVDSRTLQWRKNSNSDFSSVVNLIDYRRLATETLMLEKKPFSCPVVNVSDVTYPICLFPIQKDELVSKAAQSGETYWENDKIDHIVRLLHRLRNSSAGRNVVFVDLGANIGTYSLPILHNGFKVLSVDAQWDAILRLTLSVYLAANQTDVRKITILHNAVTRETGSLLYMNINPRNAAGSNVVPIRSCLTTVCNETSVLTITMDDLLPFVANKSSGFDIGRPQVVMKVDVEGSEPNVFTEETAGKFFQETDVVAVQMEWLFSHTVRKKQALLTFFTRRGYSIRDAASLRNRLTLRQCIQGSFIGDIILVKKRFDKMITELDRSILSLSSKNK